MDYEKLYKDAIERATKICNSGFEPYDKSILCSIIFPGIIFESEDEQYKKIQKEIINILRGKTCYTSKEDIDKYVAWLEKQGKQKSTDVEQKTHEEEDGIYLCYEDDYKKLFPTEVETTSHGKVTHIGIKVGEHKVGLKLKSLGEQEFPYNSDLDSDDFGYKKQELHALDDYDGKANTVHLKRHGEFEFDLDDDEWIPALGELAIIFKNKEKINEALAYMGGDELVDDWYWSSTEFSANSAWFVYFSNGYVYANGKPSIYVVRPVCAF